MESCGLENISLGPYNENDNRCSDVDDGTSEHPDLVDDDTEDDMDEELEDDMEDDMDDGVVYCDEEDSCDESIVIDGVVDIRSFDWVNFRPEHVKKLDFCDLEMAYLFYTWYSKMNGFSVRKSHIVRNVKGENVQQTFLCTRAGHREDRGLTLQSRKRYPRNDTRCDCKAMCTVHVRIRNSRWYISKMMFYHNHDLLDAGFCALLPAHRKMTATDKMQIENFSKVGIRPPHIYAAFANNAGGYHKVGYVCKDIYNQVARQRREQASDVSGAFKYLKELGSKDPMMFVSYTVDESSRLQHLFWCDGESQLNYEVFGDVLAFDATYKKNKYLCPFVVFSGVNNHNHTIVFAAALVSNETEETYVWLLEQFLQAMKGKAPSSVITDGDLAMKNAIRQVFPNVHHRLCAWHLLRNALSNVRNRDVLPYLKKCMLGDYEVEEFEDIWRDMVDKFGLENNSWIKDLYERRRMWSVAHMRDNFFAGIRTTSRCEAFHAHVGRYVHSKCNITDFVQQFQRCLTYFRHREFQADFNSYYGNFGLNTNFQLVERSAATQLTKELFRIFQPVLGKSTMNRVVDCQHTFMYSIYTVEKYRCRARKWHVTYCPSLLEFKCSCMRMESFGLPCGHILCVLLSLDFCELPKSLVLKRWAKGATKEIRDKCPDGSMYWDSESTGRHATLVYVSQEVCDYAYRDKEDYDNLVDFLTGELGRLKLKYKPQSAPNNDDGQPETEGDNILDPPVVRSKGCAPSSNTTNGRRRKTQTCSRCGSTGHNKRSCPNSTQVNNDGGDAVNGIGGAAIEHHMNVSDDSHAYNSQLFNDYPETFVASTSGTAGQCQ